MTAEPSPSPEAAPRRGRLVLLVALVLVAAVVVAAVFVVRARQAPAAATAADCEKEPPKVEFAVAECDGGAAPAQGGTPAAPTPAPKP